MAFRNILAAALCLAAPPALAAATDQAQFEKKVSRFARSSDFDFAKPRGLCACTEDAVGVSAGQAGLLFYSPASPLDESFVNISCVIPFFDAGGPWPEARSARAGRSSAAEPPRAAGAEIDDPPPSGLPRRPVVGQAPGSGTCEDGRFDP